MLPLFLGFVSQLLQKKFDVTMKGYFDNYEKPVLTMTSFINGEFQTNYEKWLNNNIMPRNIYIKLYNQIQFSLFDLCNRIVGKDNDIFEYGYIRCELCLDGYDYSLPERTAEMEDYINTLCEVNEKLKRVDKKLIVYTTPSKAHWYPENVPECYQVRAVDGIRGVDSFREKIAETDITYFDTDLVVDKSLYPSFYHTGIHWARTVEEQSSVEIINAIKDLTGKNYRNIELGAVRESYTPYWRDSDVFDLANLILPAEEIKYYQYDIERQIPEEFDKLRLLLQGGSFAQGLIYDYFYTYAGDEIYYINYSTSVTYDNGGVYKLESWDDLDLQFLLDQTDVIAIEMNEHHVPSYSDGFAQCLNAYLDTYTPNLSEMRMADSNLDPTIGSGLNYFDGYYWYEEGHVWAKKDSAITLYNENIGKKGLELSFSINENTLINGADEIFIYINQKLVKQMEILSPDTYNVIILPEELGEVDEDNRYDIEIICSKDFNPFILGLSGDNRDLAIDISYIGEVR